MNTINGQSAAKPLSTEVYEEGSTTISVKESTPNILGETVGNTVKIYTLNHPITGEVRYVGKTIQSLNKRLNGHIYKVGNTHTICWIKSLKKLGLTPNIELLDTCSTNNWKFWESFWIELFKSWNINLTNHSTGGEGRENVRLTEEQKLHLSKIKKGRQFTPEHMNKLREGLRNYYISMRSASKFKYQQAKIIKPKYIMTLQHNLNISKALKGRKVSSDVIKNMSNGHKKSILQIDSNGVIIKEWESAKDAAIFFNVNPSSIRHVLSGRKNKVKGYLWKYKNSI